MQAAAAKDVPQTEALFEEERKTLQEDHDEALQKHDEVKPLLVDAMALLLAKFQHKGREMKKPLATSYDAVNPCTADKEVYFHCGGAEKWSH